MEQEFKEVDIYDENYVDYASIPDDKYFYEAEPLVVAPPV